MSCCVLMFCLSYTCKEIYSSIMEGHFPLSSKREMNRLAVYSYLTRYCYGHTGCGRLFAVPLSEKR